MQASAGHFTHRVEPVDFRFSIHVGHHAATLIMGSGHHGDRLLGHINPKFEQPLVDVRKVGNDKGRGLVRDV